jgi:hypothetical protein
MRSRRVTGAYSRDSYDAKERLAIIAFVSDAEKTAAELAQGRRKRT